MERRGDAPAAERYQVELVPEPRWRRAVGGAAAVTAGVLSAGDTTAATHLLVHRARIVDLVTGEVRREVRNSLLDAVDTPAVVLADLDRLSIDDFEATWLVDA